MLKVLSKIRELFAEYSEGPENEVFYVENLDL